MHHRTIIISIVLMIGFIAVTLRLVDIMIINHDYYLNKAKGQQVKSEEIPVKRGLILDRKGRELAINLDTESVYSDSAEVKSIDETATKLASVINQKPEIIKTKLDTNKRFAWIERKIDFEHSQKIKELKLRGIGVITEPKRFYPKGSLASHIIGYVDIDNKGLEGAEERFERFLTASPAKTVVMRDAKGNILSEGHQREIKGNNVVLTIDEGLQYIVEKNLELVMKERKAASATAIMMEPHTGEILAMASLPNYDLNSPSSSTPSTRRNRAITDIYEPGSTYKIIVGVSALQEGIVNTEMKFDCSAGSVEVGGKRIKDAHRHGVLTFKEVIQKSSNVGTIKIGLKLGKEKVYEYSKLFGFGSKTGIDLIGEVSGILRHHSKWSGMSIGAISIGQEVGVTPLQVLRAYTVIANGGYLVRPHVLKEVRTPDNQVVFQSEIQKKRIISEEVSAVFRDILKTVTEDGGTAKEARVDGNLVAGKTGTAQVIDPKTKKYSKDKYISSFVGFVPADKPRFSLIVVVYEPKGAIYGGVVAGPVFRKIANESLSYLNILRDDADEKGLLVMTNQEQKSNTAR
ncbi:MAG: penicillin-binding protein 2 [Thermodesulfovibrionales bacterium]|nr:penicillin-binding protein 2 [Thermodesulfovibrionales bacterium]